MKQQEFTFSAPDLRFLLGALTPALQERLELVRRDPDLLEGMLNDERLFHSVMEEKDALLSISPRFLFHVLFRKASRELEAEFYTLERVGLNQQAAVFDTDQVVDLLRNTEVREYLVQMLTSFTKVQVTTVAFRRGGRLSRRRFSEMEVDDLLELSTWVEEDQRYRIYQRIGDLSLFLLGIFPAYLEGGDRYPVSGQVRPALWRRRRSSESYYELGQEYYLRAAREEGAYRLGLSSVLTTLAAGFTLAKKSLNLISRRYLGLSKFTAFQTSP